MSYLVSLQRATFDGDIYIEHQKGNKPQKLENALLGTEELRRKSKLIVASNNKYQNISHLRMFRMIRVLAHVATTNTIVFHSTALCLYAIKFHREW